MYLSIVLSIVIEEKRNFYDAKLFCENKNYRLMIINESVSHIPRNGVYWIGTFRQDVATDKPIGNHKSLQYIQ